MCRQYALLDNLLTKDVMNRLFLMIILVVYGYLPSFSQDDQAIEITWLNAPSETQDKLLTLKWGIKAKSQITNVMISLNGASLKGINAVSNDGYDMVKSQTVNLEEGDNDVNIVVTTENGRKEANKKIICKSSNNNDDEDKENFDVDVDVVVGQAYQNDSVAQYILGKMYMDGRNNMKKDALEVLCGSRNRQKQVFRRLCLNMPYHYLMEEESSRASLLVLNI